MSFDIEGLLDLWTERHHDGVITEITMVADELGALAAARAVELVNPPSPGVATPGG